MIKKKGKKYILYTSDGSRILGEHSSKEDAMKQEQAIQISKAKRAGKLPQNYAEDRSDTSKNVSVQMVRGNYCVFDLIGDQLAAFPTSGEMRQWVDENGYSIINDSPFFSEEAESNVLNFSEEECDGHFIAFTETSGVYDKDPYIEIEARLFKTGKHKGIDFSQSDLDQMVTNFSSPQNDMDWETPIQTDHSESAWHTVGHVRNVRREGDNLLGRLRVIGSEAIRKVRSGLWKKLSIGLYQNPYKVREVTVTPFPEVRGSQVAFSETNEEVLEMSKKKEKEEKKEEPREEEEEESPEEEEEETPEEEEEEEKEEEEEEEKPKKRGKKFSESHTSDNNQSILEMREEFMARTQALENELKKQKQVMRFRECAGAILQFNQEGKILPANNEKALEFTQTLSDKQLGQFLEFMEEQSPLIEFGQRSSPHIQRPGGESEEDVDQEARSLLRESGYMPVSDLIEQYQNSAE